MTSSAIERVGYDAETRRLSIWFKGGRRYVYADVPPSIYDQLCTGGRLNERAAPQPRFREE